MNTYWAKRIWDINADKLCLVRKKPSKVLEFRTKHSIYIYIWVQDNGLGLINWPPIINLGRHCSPYHTQAAITTCLQAGPHVAISVARKWIRISLFIVSLRLAWHWYDPSAGSNHRLRHWPNSGGGVRLSLCSTGYGIAAIPVPDNIQTAINGIWSIKSPGASCLTYFYCCLIICKLIPLCVHRDIERCINLLIFSMTPLE